MIQYITFGILADPLGVDGPPVKNLGFRTAMSNIIFSFATNMANKKGHSSHIRANSVETLNFELIKYILVQLLVSPELLSGK